MGGKAIFADAWGIPCAPRSATQKHDDINATPAQLPTFSMSRMSPPGCSSWILTESALLKRNIPFAQPKRFQLAHLSTCIKSNASVPQSAEQVKNGLQLLGICPETVWQMDLAPEKPSIYSLPPPSGKPPAMGILGVQIHLRIQQSAQFRALSAEPMRAGQNARCARPSQFSARPRTNS